MNTALVYALGVFTGLILMACLVWRWAAGHLQSYDQQRLHLSPDDWARVAEELVQRAEPTHRHDFAGRVVH